MANRRKESRFFIYAKEKSGRYKGKRRMGVNHLFVGGTENLTIKDLIDFLEEKDIKPDEVKLPSTFTTTTV